MKVRRLVRCRLFLWGLLLGVSCSWGAREAAPILRSITEPPAMILDGPDYSFVADSNTGFLPLSVGQPSPDWTSSSPCEHAVLLRRGEDHWTCYVCGTDVE